MGDCDRLKPRPSGAFNRKRKLEHSIEDKRQSVALKQFLFGKLDSKTKLISIDDNDDDGDHIDETSQLPVVSKRNNPSPSSSREIVEVPVPEENEVVSHDPRNWPANIPTSISDIIVQRGPEQVFDVEFPVNGQGRRFSVNSYRRRMYNGEEMSRPWLVHSVCKDTIFCFCCRLFGKNHSSPLTSETGYCDWKHMSGLLSEHEGSPSHMFH